MQHRCNMSEQLSLAEQVSIAGELTYRAEIFHAAWFAIASREGRERHRVALVDHAEILVMTQAAHMSALVVTLHSLFEVSRRTVNLPGISKQLDDAQAPELQACAPIAKKVAKLRHNLFAHRSGRLSKQDIFKLAEITPNDLQWLAFKASAISRVFHRLAGLPDPPAAIGARAAILNLLDSVSRDAEASWPPANGFTA